MRQDRFPMLTSLAAHSKSITDQWCHYKPLEAAILVGEVAWADLKEHADVTWKGLPVKMAIDPGSLLASPQRGFVALATLTVQSELTVSQTHKPKRHLHPSTAAETGPSNRGDATGNTALASVSALAST